MVVTLLGVLTLGFLGVIGFGLITGRIDWRQQGCCAVPADRDRRMQLSTEQLGGDPAGAANRAPGAHY